MVFTGIFVEGIRETANLRVSHNDIVSGGGRLNLKAYTLFGGVALVLSVSGYVQPCTKWFVQGHGPLERLVPWPSAYFFLN